MDIDIASQLKVHDRVLFGHWISENMREHGVVEKTQELSNSYRHLVKKITRIERMIQVIGLLLSVPVLNSLGLPTKEMAPSIIRLILHVVGV